MLALGACLALGFTLTACNVDNHTHAYESEWSHDATYHWHACEVEGCNKTSQKAKHSFVDDVCSVCSFERDNSVPVPAKEWEDYFVFDNVTATRTIVQNTIGASHIEYTTVETMKQAGNEWLLERHSENPLGGGETVDVAYWDGTQLYAEVESTVEAEGFRSYGEYWFNEVEFFSYFESGFEERATGVFEAGEISLSTSSYTNVRIVIAEGNLQSIEYSTAFESGGETVSQAVEMTFSNWNTTEITYTPSGTPEPNPNPNPEPEHPVYEVTQAQFEALMSEENLSNVTVAFEMFENTGVEVAQMCGKVYFDGNKIQLETSADGEHYQLTGIYELTETTTYLYVYMDETYYQGWIRTDYGALIEENEVMGIKALVSGIEFAEVEYVEGGYYTCTKVAEDGALAGYEVDFKIRFENDALVSLLMDLSAEDVEVYEMFEFSNFGTTSVTLPAEYQNMEDLMG